MSKAAFYRITHKARKTLAPRRRADAADHTQVVQRPISPPGKQRRRPMWFRRLRLP